MNKYLLLRDNKQTGPYSVEELTTKGLKPYDLVWLDGKSAAWRYPSEIAELKAFAPAVEEQPYDRFYKKTTAQQSVTQATQANITYQQPVPTEAIVVTTPVTANNTPQPVIAKKIYVTLPAGAGNRGNTATTTASGKTASADSQASEKEDSSASLLNEKFARLREEKIKQAETAAANTVKQEVPAPVFSEIVQKNHPRQEEKLAPIMLPGTNKHRLLMRSIAAACLLLGGVIIGLVISNNRQQKDSAALDQLVKQIQERDKKNQLSAQEAALPLTQGNLTSIDNNQAAVQQQSAAEPDNNNKQEPIGTPVNHKVDLPAMKESLPVKDVSQRQTVKVIPALVTNKPEENQVNRQEVEQARKNIHQMVAVDANKYKTGVLGGISDLQLTISNNSLYPLDEVQVEVRYLGPEKRVVKTQMLLFNDVAPGEQKTIEAPPTNRGVTVDYVITRINSKALGLAHAGY